MPNRRNEYDESNLTEDDYEKYFLTNWKEITVLGIVIFVIIYGCLYWFGYKMRTNSNKKVTEAKQLIDKADDSLPEQVTPQTIRIKEFSTGFQKETTWILRKLNEDSFPQEFNSRLKKRYLEASPAYTLPDNWKNRLPPSVDKWAKQQRRRQQAEIQRFDDRLKSHLKENKETIETIRTLRKKLEDVPLGGARKRFKADLRTLERESNQALETIKSTGITGPQFPRALFNQINDLVDPMIQVSLHLDRLTGLTSAPSALVTAELTLQDALRIDPKNPRAYYQLGRVYEKMHLDVISGEHFARALRFNPNFEKKDEILQRLRQDVEENPNSARDHYELGFALYEAGKMKQSEEHLWKVLELEENKDSMSKVLAFKRLNYIHKGEPPYHIMAFF